MASASQSPYDVAATIKVINHTKWPLKLESCHLSYGHIETVINLVQPGQYDIMRTHKKGFTTSGTSGTVAWRVEGMQTSVIVMWSLPYSPTFSSNVLAVGVCGNGRISAATFDEMFCKEETYFKRKEYYKIVDPVEYLGTDVIVTGIMGTTNKADITINIEPTDTFNRFEYQVDNATRVLAHQAAMVQAATRHQTLGAPLMLPATHLHMGAKSGSSPRYCHASASPVSLPVPDDTGRLLKYAAAASADNPALAASLLNGDYTVESLGAVGGFITR